MRSGSHFASGLVLAGVLAAGGFAADAAAVSGAGQTTAPQLIVATADNADRVRLTGNIHPAVTAASDRGAVPASLSLDHVYLQLKHSAARDQALQQFLREQQDRTSSSYHRWLSPEQFAQQFGPAAADVQAVSAWLQAQGLQVQGLARGGAFIQFSGTAAAITRAFQTPIHYYSDASGQHWANSSDPQIPAAFAPAVGGVVGLNNFPARPQHHVVGAVVRDRATGGWRRSAAAGTGALETPALTTGNPAEYDLGPNDFAIIYNVLPLWTAGTDGTGETIAVVGQSNINLQDVSAYRSAFGLPANNPTVVVPPGTLDPGQTNDDDENEALLDVELSGAVARNATILFVPQTNVLDSAVYVVDNALAPILSVSFGQCELNLGTSGNQFFGGGGGTTGLWQQAAAEGMTVVVSAGDAGSTGCENFGQTPNAAQFGVAVSGFASTPYNIAVGGTDFNDSSSYSQYWNSSNASGTLASAKSYIPEMTWNDSCASPIILQLFGAQLGVSNNEALCNDSKTEQYFLNVVGGSGGFSACTTPSSDTPQSCAGGYARPSWQANVYGIPSSGNRIIPDVSLFAGNGEFNHAYVICDSAQTQGQSCAPANGVFLAIGGTSASAPAFAGIMALVDQKQVSAANPDGRQGLANPVLYQMAASAFGGSSPSGSLSGCNSSQGGSVGSSCVFYDVTAGNDAVPCITGTPDCVTAVNGDEIGLIQVNGSPAYGTAAGFDVATGLGSVNAANLVGGWGAAAGSIQATTTALSSSTTTVAEGSPVNFAATVTASSGTPSGTVVFKEGASVIGAQALANGQASFSSSKLPGGTHSFSALYGGGNGFAASASQALTITVQGPAVSLAPVSVQFGAQAVNTTSATRAITLSNSGNMPLTINSIGASGDFAQTNSCGSSLAAGASCTISVSFTPSATGTRNGVITVSSNAVTSPDTVPLIGSGGISPASFSPTSLAFGNQLAGTASDPQTVTLSNTGSAQLSINSLTISPAFAQTNTCGSALLPGASCTISVVFAPQALGAQSGSLAVATSASTGPAPVTLTGTGTGVPAVSLSPAALTFGNQAVGTTSGPQSATLTNIGNAPLSINNITTTGDFSVGSSCSDVIAAGASCALSVTFSPTAAGQRNGTLVVNSNAASSPNSVALGGSGTGGTSSSSSSSGGSSSGGSSSSSSSSSGGSSSSSSSSSSGGSSGGVGLKVGGAFSPAMLLMLAPAAMLRRRKRGGRGSALR